MAHMYNGMPSWMDLGDISLSEISQSLDRYSMIPSFPSENRAWLPGVGEGKTGAKFR